jgi:formate dehydrogenase subunit delta
VSSHTLDKLIYMANQIAREFGFQQPDQAAEATADHLRKYWEPRMRGLFINHARRGGEGLSDIARAAAPLLDQDAPTLSPAEGTGADG